MSSRAAALTPDQAKAVLHVISILMPYAALLVFVLVLYLCVKRDISR